LIDKSAFVRVATHPQGAEWLSRIRRGLVLVSSVTKLELGYSARNAQQLRSDHSQPPLTLMPRQYLSLGAEDRAVEVQILLADRGHHRGPSIPDLLLAATAELAGLTVLAHDQDFRLIAEITGQPIDDLDGPVYRNA
jgi:predicted nucleic acid-binding protein